VGQTGYAFVNQGDGLVIMHPGQAIAMKLNLLKDKAISPDLKTTSERMKNREKGLARYEFMGVEKYVTFAPINGVNWSIERLANREAVNRQSTYKKQNFEEFPEALFFSGYGYHPLILSMLDEFSDDRGELCRYKRSLS
jgi:hypothetical protein